MQMKNVNYSKFIKIISILLAIAGVFLTVYYFQNKNNKALVDIEPTSVEQINEAKETEKVVSSEIEPPALENIEVSLPEKFLLEVPFQSQAP